METTDKGSPLRITITATGQENLVLRALLRQSVPMLLKPDAFLVKQRGQLAQDITLLLDGTLVPEDILPDPVGTENAYEPGSREEMEDPW